MPDPRCFLCGRRTRRFLVKLEVEDSYICRICENGAQTKRQRPGFPGKPDYEFARQEIDHVPHVRRSKMMIFSNEELQQRYEDEVLAAEDGFN